MENKFNQKGLTLVELLAVIVIASIVVVFVSTILVSSMKNYTAISGENALRDEADLLMSQAYKKMYTIKESQICPVDNSDPYAGSYISVTSNTTKSTIAEKCAADKSYIGFKDNQYFLGTNTPYTISNKEIEIVSGAVSLDPKATKGLYNIELTLKLKSKNKTKTFKNKVRTINNN